MLVAHWVICKSLSGKREGGEGEKRESKKMTIAASATRNGFIFLLFKLLCSSFYDSLEPLRELRRGLGGREKVSKQRPLGRERQQDTVSENRKKSDDGDHCSTDQTKGRVCDRRATRDEVYGTRSAAWQYGGTCTDASSSWTVDTTAVLGFRSLRL